MSKFTRSLVLMLAMAGMSGTVLSVSSVAQEKAKEVKKATKETTKDDSKKTTKDDTKKAAVKPGIVRIGEGKDGKFRFSIYNAEGDFLAMSGANSFATKEEALKGLEELKAALKETKVEYTKIEPKKEKKEKN